MEGVNLFFLLLVMVSAIDAEENCSIPDKEISKIGEILANISKPIYEVEPDVDNLREECAQLLNTIHTQLRRLTQRYKLMNKGYVKKEEFEKMTQEYEKQLKKLNEELDQFKKETVSNAENVLKGLHDYITILEGNVKNLHQNLNAVSADYEKVQKALCITYLESNQISNAQNKMQGASSKLLIEFVEDFLKIANVSVLPVIVFSESIEDLDDRGEAYKTIYDFIKSNNRLKTNDTVYLEAELLKMNATLVSGSKITDERKEELQAVLRNLSIHSEKMFDKWTNDSNPSINMVDMKNIMDSLFLTQMTKLGEKIGNKKDFISLRKFLKLLALSNNHYKIAAYKVLIGKKVTHAFGVIWVDMFWMDYNELKHNPLVSGLFNRTYDRLPTSLKEIGSCKDSVNIYHFQDGVFARCIVATQKSQTVIHPNTRHPFGTLKQVIIEAGGCTRFRVEASSDKASVRIVTTNGDALTNINSATPNFGWYGQVGAPYTNNVGQNLGSSQDWMLEATHSSKKMKIESEYKPYKKENGDGPIDYLLANKHSKDPSVVLVRYGDRAVKMLDVRNLLEWKFKCVANKQ